LRLKGVGVLGVSVHQHHILYCQPLFAAQREARIVVNLQSSGLGRRA